jgi:hypothetical protein
MQAHLSTTTFDFDGHITLDLLGNESDLGETTRRVTRVATLDGSAAVNDFGHSYADRTLRLRWQPEDEAQAEAVNRLVRLYNRLQVSVDGRMYLTAPQGLVRTENYHELALLVVERLED